MTDKQRLTELRNALPSPSNAGGWDWQQAARPPTEQPAAGRRRRRFDRDIGGCIGGIVLGVGGCFFGVSRPYQHPVAIAISVLWWGIYLGCLGLSIGALVGLWAEQLPAHTPASDDARKQ